MPDLAPEEEHASAIKEARTLASPDKKFIQSAFDSIAHRYDFLNVVLSFNLDDVWRRKSKNVFFQGSEKSILDLGTGSGKFIECFMDEPGVEKLVGLDFSEEMLKIASKRLPDRITWVSGDFHDLPFPAGEFDLIISAYTLRSVQDVPSFMREVYRCLAPGGRAAFLCLTRPKNFFCKLLFYPYLKLYLPVVGWLFSGNMKAYQFLSQSVETFQPPEETLEHMKTAGFVGGSTKAFTFGAATLIMADKPWSQ